MWTKCPEFARLLLCSDAHWESNGQSGGPLPTYFLNHAGGPVHGVGGSVSHTSVYLWPWHGLRSACEGGRCQEPGLVLG